MEDKDLVRIGEGEDKYFTVSSGDFSVTVYHNDLRVSLRIDRVELQSERFEYIKTFYGFSVRCDEETAKNLYRCLDWVFSRPAKQPIKEYLGIED